MKTEVLYSKHLQLDYCVGRVRIQKTTDAPSEDKLRFCRFLFSSLRHRYGTDATSEEQLQARLSKLDKHSLRDWESRLQDFRRTWPTQENPYAVTVTDSDDGLWVRTFATWQQAEEFANLLVATEPLTLADLYSVGLYPN